MNLLAEQENSIFLGQAVAYPGTAMTGTLANVPDSKKLEMPVIEEAQLGISIGLALQGFLPVSIYPRWNFLLLATNQIVNHLDKIPLYSDYRPKVIIRTSVGSERPMWPGQQHIGDFSTAFKLMCDTVCIARLLEPEHIVSAYQAALDREESTILVEYGDFHNEK